MRFPAEPTSTSYSSRGHSQDVPGYIPGVQVPESQWPEVTDQRTPFSLWQACSVCSPSPQAILVGFRWESRKQPFQQLTSASRGELD